MEFRMLGALEVVDEGRQLQLRGAKQRELLVLLLLHASRPVSTSRLIDELWHETPPDAARKGVQVLVSQLRKTLGADRVLTRGAGYALRIEPRIIGEGRHLGRRLAAQGIKLLQPAR